MIEVKDCEALSYASQKDCEIALQEALIHTRGTLKSIEDRLGILAKREVRLTPFENPLEENDDGFQFNMGIKDDIYLDMDMFLLPTNARENNETVYFITEISSSY